MTSLHLAQLLLLCEAIALAGLLYIAAADLYQRMHRAPRRALRRAQAPLAPAGEHYVLITERALWRAGVGLVGSGVLLAIAALVVSVG